MKPVHRLFHLLLSALCLAAAQAAPNLPRAQQAPPTRLATCLERSASALRPPASGLRPLEAWSDKSVLWPQKSVLRVLFLSGSAGQKDAAWKRFAVIDDLVNLTFRRVENAPAEIRVRFDGGAGHWSYVGKDCLGVPARQPTMNLALRSGWFGDGNDEWDRVVLHEVLHAIGLYHEHQHPLSSIPWNVPAVLAYYRSTQGWSDAQIRAQVLDKEPRRPGYLGTRYDPASIMEYPIPAELTRNGFSVGWNRQLSPLDVQFVRSLYPAGKR